MTQIIPYQIHRTETLIIDGQPYTAYFSNAGIDHMVSLVSDDRTKTFTAHFGADIANDFKMTTGQKLADAVLEVLKGDAARKAP